MIFTSLLSIAALLPLISADTEVIQGYTFVKSGPKVVAPLVQYQLPTYKTATRILKDRLGPDGLLSLLQPDIAEANAFWHEAMDKSTGQWVPTDGRVAAFLPNVTATRFALWSQSTFADRANNAANAEHYIKRTKQVAPGKLESEVLEGWGGVTTYFSILNYGTPDRTKYPFLRELPEFPIQAAGEKVLRDGTGAIFGILHISVRDVKGEDFGTSGPGHEIYATVWYGDGVQDDHIELERQHIVIEIINLSIQCQKDIESGEFMPPV